jgi:hypothetical protein
MYPAKVKKGFIFRGSRIPAGASQSSILATRCSDSDRHRTESGYDTKIATCLCGVHERIINYHVPIPHAMPMARHSSLRPGCVQDAMISRWHGMSDSEIESNARLRGLFKGLHGVLRRRAVIPHARVAMRHVAVLHFCGFCSAA